VVLLMGLLAALIFNFGALKSGASLDEGARQFEALVRFAGAHAANTGRSVQFRFEETSTNDLSSAGPSMRVVREIDPVAQPGVFEDAPDAQPFLAELLERVRFIAVKGGERPVNQATNQISNLLEETTAPTMPPITFYPDGSSDSAAIILESRDPEDSRRMTIHLAGVTGGIRTEIQQLDEMIPLEWMDDEEAATEPIAETTPDLPERSNDLETTSTNDFPDELP
jgi:hypothetical protein